MSVIPPCLYRCMFEVLVDELRTHSTEWLRREREELISQQRNLRTREMAVLRVLDERGQVDCSMGSAGESARTVRDKVETALALEALPAIADVAVSGVPDEVWGERLHAVVVLREGLELTSADLAAFCRDRIAGYKIPRSLGLIDALPRNANGKVLKTELRGRLVVPTDRIEV